MSLIFGKKYPFLWLIALLFTVSPVQASVQLFDNTTPQVVGDNFSVYHESGVAYSIGDVIKLRHEFIYQADANPNYGFSDFGAWLRADISNLSHEENWVFTLNFSQLSKVDFYLIINNEVVSQSHQGVFQSGSDYRVPTFDVRVPSGQQAELFIRIESDSSSLIAPVYAMSTDWVVLISQIDSLLWGLFYGGLIILGIYNLVLFVGSKEWSLIAYVTYIATVVTWQIVWGGHLYFYMPNEFSQLIYPYTSLMFIVMGISAGIFSVTFLETKRNAPTAHAVIVSMLWLQVLIGAITLFDLLPTAWERNIVYSVTMLSICCYIASGIEAYVKRYYPARYFIFAWGILATGALVGILSLISIVPSNILTSYCFQVTVFCEAGLFSFALMEKSRGRLENEVSQATNELRHNMELIEEQNARLDIARKDAIKASNVKSQFLANMSHEIRTPLNAILGFSKELTHLSIPIDKMEQVQIINTAADNLLTIVNDVLDFSKIEAGKLHINNKPFSPISLLEEMVTMMSTSAHVKNIEFIFELAPLPEKLIGDVFRIRQILNNLLSNALKFTSSGYIKLGVKGRSLPQGILQLELIIEDTGIGISRKDRSKLFNAFSQIDDALNRSYQGTGLGLVICQELVKLMQGQLTLKSLPGQGTTFAVILNTNRLSQRFALAPVPEWQNKKVVIFDPSPVSRMASSQMMTYLGAQVCSVESIAFLQTLDGDFDYLFANLPIFKMKNREQMLESLCIFPASKRVLWYSGDSPLVDFPAYTEDFSSQIRLPYTPTKLDSLIHGHDIEAPSRVQQKKESLPPARVLAVDDMEMNLKLLSAWLENSSVSLTLSNSGKESVSLCNQLRFDLILMDVQMPGMDGIQATKLIRKSSLNKQTPIIAITAHAFKEEQDRLLASGMTEYLPKPLEFNALIQMIKHLCQHVKNKDMALPSMDWQLAVKRANESRDHAMELFKDFVNHLPIATDAIRQHWASRDFVGVQDELHRLHGACCYTGAPKLQALTHDIESLLKQGKHFETSQLLPIFFVECEIVAAQISKFVQDNKEE